MLVNTLTYKVPPILLIIIINYGNGAASYFLRMMIL